MLHESGLRQMFQFGPREGTCMPSPGARVEKQIASPHPKLARFRKVLSCPIGSFAVRFRQRFWLQE